MYFPTSISKKKISTSAVRIIAGLATLALAYGCQAATEHSASITNSQDTGLGIQNPQGARQTELAHEWGGGLRTTGFGLGATAGGCLI